MREALPVVGSTALAMAKGTSGVGSAGGADTATAVVPKVLGPRAYGRAGGTGARMATAWRGLAWGRCTAAKGEQLPVESE